MNEVVTKDDLRQFRMMLVDDFRKIINENSTQNKPENQLNLKWLKSRAVKKLLDISPASIQNLRISGKVRYKKVLGSYYYNREDLENLFKGK